ncbi:hypothetical protein MP638_003635 [Amoeboaphelidium occidentale]|nr:hypothetical protein MP638_003635 [Amoeboaphelidium occidentale]
MLAIKADDVYRMKYDPADLISSKPTFQFVAHKEGFINPSKDFFIDWLFSRVQPDVPGTERWRSLVDRFLTPKFPYKLDYGISVKDINIHEFERPDMEDFNVELRAVSIGIIAKAALNVTVYLDIEGEKNTSSFNVACKKLEADVDIKTTYPEKTTSFKNPITNATDLRQCATPQIDVNIKKFDCGPNGGYFKYSGSPFFSRGSTWTNRAFTLLGNPKVLGWAQMSLRNMIQSYSKQMNNFIMKRSNDLLVQLDRVAEINGVDLDLAKGFCQRNVHLVLEQYSQRILYHAEGATYESWRPVVGSEEYKKRFDSTIHSTWYVPPETRKEPVPFWTKVQNGWKSFTSWISSWFQ